MTRIPQNQFSLTSTGTRHQFAAAFALVCVIPLLTLWYLALARPRLPEGPALPWEEAAVVTALTAFVAMGFALLLRYPTNITRLRTYLESMVGGEFPEAIALISSENDMRAIEAALQTLVGRLKQRISLVESEKDELERQLYQAQKLETMGALAAGIAHEINTPVQFVYHNMEFLEHSVKSLLHLVAVYQSAWQRCRDGQDLPALCAELRQAEAAVELPTLQAETLAAVTESREGLARIVEIGAAMKSYLHPGTGPQKTAADVNRIVEETVVLSRNQWKHVAEVRQELDPELPPVPCVVGEVRQVLMNLVINAAHAIEGARSGNGHPKGVITIRTGQANQAVVIAVADTGTGIPPAIQERVFERFFTTKAAGKGTGLGLTMARSSVVNRHGGTLTFETEEGQGTTFTATLPLEPRPAAEGPRTRATAAAA